jgi:hypothetical protein
MLRQCAHDAADVLTPFAFAVLTLCTSLQSLAAQESFRLAPGARVRVWTSPDGRRHQGTLVAIDSLALRIRSSSSAHYSPADPRFVPASERLETVKLAAVRRLEVSRGRRAGAIAGGIALGLLGGAVIGGAIGYATTQCTGCEDPGIGAIVGAPVGGLVGAFVGGVIGAHLSERWERVRLPSRVSVVPRWSPNGVLGLSASVAF